MKFKPQNTAITRKKPSLPLSYLVCDSGLVGSKAHSFLDYGCGRGDDSRWLLSQGFYAIGWDKFHKSTPKPAQGCWFNTVLVSYVLNVIPTPQERTEVIKDAWGYVGPGDCMMISTRPKNEINSEAEKKGWERCGDGYITSTSRGTFQCGFTGGELSEIVTSCLEGIDHIESYSGSDYSYVIVRRKKD